MPISLLTLETDLQSVVTAITGAFTTADLMTVVSAVIGAVAGYVVLWFGVRKIIKGVRSGIFGGKLRV